MYDYTTLIPRLSPYMNYRFSVLQAMKAGRGLGTRLVQSYVSIRMTVLVQTYLWSRIAKVHINDNHDINVCI